MEQTIGGLWSLCRAGEVKQPPWPRLGQRNQSLPTVSGWEDHVGRALRVDLAQGGAAFIDEAALAAGGGAGKSRSDRLARRREPWRWRPLPSSAGTPFVRDGSASGSG